MNDSPEQSKTKRTLRFKVSVPMVVVILVLTLAAWVGYDVVLPMLEVEQTRKLVLEEIHIGDDWAVAEKRLNDRGQHPVMFVRTREMTDYMIAPSHPSLLYRGWGLVAGLLGGIKIPFPAPPTAQGVNIYVKDYPVVDSSTSSPPEQVYLVR